MGNFSRKEVKEKGKIHTNSKTFVQGIPLLARDRREIQLRDAAAEHCHQLPEDGGAAKPRNVRDLYDKKAYKT